MNTKIHYLYRDADNYKMPNRCVISGEMTEAQIAQIMDCLDEGEYFIPCQVGLPEERFEKTDPQADHCWFELSADGFELTGDPSDLPLTASQLVQNFLTAKDRWDDSWMEKEGLL